MYILKISKFLIFGEIWTEIWTKLNKAVILEINIFVYYCSKQMTTSDP